MILIKLKNDAEYWTESTQNEIIDGISYVNFQTKSKKGKVFKHTIARTEIIEMVDVGELPEKEMHEDLEA